MIGPPIPPAIFRRQQRVAQGARPPPIDGDPAALVRVHEILRQPIEAGDAGQRIRATAADSVGHDTARPAEFRADARAFHIHFRDIEPVDFPLS